MLHKLFFFIGLISITADALSQKTWSSYPQDEFVFPIKPGQYNQLMGSMGELRSNHFHGGLDIRTEMRVGLPVYAAADGYVSRIRMSTVGYGNVIYITHYNGYVTVYAHLLNFSDTIEEYTKKYQYEQETFEIELFPQKGQLPVRKREVIALSGNTGSSGGPHLHFEIRDTSGTVLNPLLFGFKEEIKDPVSPTFSRLALVPLDRQSRIEGVYDRKEYGLLRSGNNYRIPQTVEATGRIGIEIEAYDRGGSHVGRNAINCIEVFVDGEETFTYNMEHFEFEHTRCLNVHLNYEEYVRRGRKFERCYKADGNLVNNYKGSGQIHITGEHEVKIAIWDSYKNVSYLDFNIRQGQNPDSLPDFKTNLRYSPQASYNLNENMLHIQTKYTPHDTASLFFDGGRSNLRPAYRDEYETGYLWNLKSGLPDSALVGGQLLVFNFDAAIPSNKKTNWYGRDLELSFDKNTLFDTLYLQAVSKGNHAWQIGTEETPLFQPLKATVIVDSDSFVDRNRVHAYYLRRRGGKRFLGGHWQSENRFSFDTKYLGNVALLEDNKPPVIRPVTLRNNSLRFVIKDDLSGIGTYRATLNGNFLLMRYDYKTALLWADPPKDMDKMQGLLELVVTDQAGNETTYQRDIM